MSSKLLQEYNRLIQASRVYELARETPMQLMQQLSARLDQHIYLKREDLNPIFSFKLRGAYNLISSLTDPKSAMALSLPPLAIMRKELLYPLNTSVSRRP